MVDKDRKIYTPIIYNFDTKLMNKIPKPKYLINSNVLIQQHCNEDIEKILMFMNSPAGFIIGKEGEERVSECKTHIELKL